MTPSPARQVERLRYLADLRFFLDIWGLGTQEVFAAGLEDLNGMMDQVAAIQQGLTDE